VVAPEQPQRDDRLCSDGSTLSVATDPPRTPVRSWIGAGVTWIASGVIRTLAWFDPVP
jgi:hypothetical protein